MSNHSFVWGITINNICTIIIQLHFYHALFVIRPIISFSDSCNYQITIDICVAHCNIAKSNDVNIFRSVYQLPSSLCSV